MRKLKRISLPLFIALGLIITAQVVLAEVWGPPANHLNLSRASTNAGYPAVAVSSDAQNIGFVWSQGWPGTNTAQGPVYLKAASDGFTISVRTAVDFANSDTNQSLAPDVASDPQNGDYMYVVWENIEDDADTVFVKRCETTTGSCSNEVQLETVNSTNGDVTNPRIATSKHLISGSEVTVVHLAWQSIDYGPNPDTRVIKYASGYWNGSGTWTTRQWPPLAVSVALTNRWSSHPAIAVSTDPSDNYRGEYVHIAWADDANRDDVNGTIGYRRGALSAVGQISGWTPAVGNNPYLLRAGGGIAAGVIGGNVSGVFSGGDTDYPALAAFNGRVMLLWDEKATVSAPPPDEYYLAYFISTDHGANFTTQEVLRNTTASAAVRYMSDNSPTASGNSLDVHAERLQVDAAAENANIFHIVWHSNTYTSTNTFHDVFYNRWCSGGTSCSPGWAYVDAVTSGSNETEFLKYDGPYQGQDAPYYSYSPDIAAASDNKVYVVYMEGDQNFQPSLALAHFDVIYNGTVRLTDTTTTGGGGVYLPVIMKNAS